MSERHASAPAAHRMVETAAAGEVSFFHCPHPGCGRRLSFDRKRLELTVLQPGDVLARHHGSTPAGQVSIELS